MYFSSAVFLTFLAFATANPSPTQSSPTTRPDRELSSIPTAAPEAQSNIQHDLKRQAPGQIVGAGVPNSPSPTQMSPITTFLAYGPDGKQTPHVYTQTFAAVPDQWSPPASGVIGLGTITGQVGIVKTKAKRNYIAEATAVIKRSVHGLEKRKKKGGSGSGNAASGLTVPLLSVAAALGVGILAIL